MNARSQVLELRLESRQVEEAVLALFHTILFHRCYGKFSYNDDSTFIIGTLGYEDVECEHIDATYVRVSSPSLIDLLRSNVASLVSKGDVQQQLSLEFFERRTRRTWTSLKENVPWEIWTVNADVVGDTDDHNHELNSVFDGHMLADKLLYVTELINRHEYVPKMPCESELERVFDQSFEDVQPYLFRLSNVKENTNDDASVSSTVKRLIRGTLAM